MLYKFRFIVIVITLLTKNVEAIPSTAGGLFNFIPLTWLTIILSVSISCLKSSDLSFLNLVSTVDNLFLSSLVNSLLNF